ncbi:MAG: exodeoxyribonuclease VII large subunit [Actinobacteria bacterium]|nr:exodeoxyribonuclease VII large subunit [Actinomycetota bacterium]NDH37740.1 exodeoxyribonuclease VII large subunit [Actinomycetota bacterium]
MLETSAEKPVPVRVVSEAISDYINRLGQIWVEGEIAQLNDRAGSGMVYMRLRDPSVDMYLEVTCPRSVFKAVAPLTDNARVVINSKVNFYTPTGRLSLNAKEIRQVGVGELLARLEALKKMLAAEGLFASERKKPLPFLPKKIGLICGRASAAEKDVKENAKRRWPAVIFETREVAVQGADAVIQVSAALRELEADPDVDVIIITRGGGSFEDLLPFSDEGLVRLAAACKKPIVSAIGHEQDTPLLDLVADLRASTPTDAAKRVVPDIQEEFEKISQLRQRADRKINDRVVLEMTKVVGLIQRSFASINSRLMRSSEELTHLIARVRTLSPQATLDRGYAVVQKRDGSIVRSPKALTKGEELRLRLAEGVAVATATGEGTTDSTTRSMKGE